MDGTHIRRAVWAAITAGLLTCACTSPALACANESAGVKWGAGVLPAQWEPMPPEELAAYLNPAAFDAAQWTGRASFYIKQQQTHKLTIDQRNDYALCLLFAGKVEQARDIWLAIETERPGLYPTASNVGTAYELLGDNVNAKHWIAEGIKRNPMSHQGSEWLHLLILENKLLLEGNPYWLDGHSVLGMDFGTDPRPRRPLVLARGNRGETLNMHQVIEGIAFQLQERLKFVRTADPVVASLLTDLGNALLVEKAPESALIAYKRAQDYGAKGDLLMARIEYAHNFPRGTGALPWMLVLAAALIVAGTLLLRRMKRGKPVEAGA